MKRSSRPVVLVALALVVVGLTGCSVTNPQTTQLQYRPGDGAQVELAGVGVYAMVLVAAAADEPGNLVGRVVNTTGEARTVSLVGSGAATFDVQLEVKARDTLDIGPEAEQVLVEPAGQAPGRTVPVTVTIGQETGQLDVPVLDATFERYADLVP